MIESIPFEKTYVQIDLFGLSVELLAKDGTEYHFFFKEEVHYKSCYVLKKMARKKKWSEPELLKTRLDPKAKFVFSEQNEFGFVLN